MNQSNLGLIIIRLFSQFYPKKKYVEDRCCTYCAY